MSSLDKDSIRLLGELIDRVMCDLINYGYGKSWDALQRDPVFVRIEDAAGMLHNAQMYLRKRGEK